MRGYLGLIVAASILAEPAGAASKSESERLELKNRWILRRRSAIAALPCNSLSRYIWDARANRVMLAGLCG
jgi:hypothetical protein